MTTGERLGLLALLAILSGVGGFIALAVASVAFPSVAARVGAYLAGFAGCALLAGWHARAEFRREMDDPGGG